MRKILIEVEVLDEAEDRGDGTYVTRLTHPNLAGELLLIHGRERENLLQAITIDPKLIDPVSAMIKGIEEFTRKF